MHCYWHFCAFKICALHSQKQKAHENLGVYKYKKQMKRNNNWYVTHHKKTGINVDICIFFHVSSLLWKKLQKVTKLHEMDNTTIV
jgi:hypothetical protein